MSSQLYELLSKLKHTNFGQSEYEAVKELARKQGRRAVNLWKFKPQIRILFKMGKFQSYMMLLLGVTVLPFTLYQKYQQDKEKLTRILIFTPFALGACFGPILMYKRFSKKLIQSVSYNLESKKLLLTRFRDGVEMEAKIGEIGIVKSERGKVKELVWNHPIVNVDNYTQQQQPMQQQQLNKQKDLPATKYQIQGLGEWQSLQLFNFILEQSNKQHI